MNTKYVVGAVVVGFAAIAIAVVVLQGRPAGDVNGTPVTNTQVSEERQSARTLRELLSLGDTTVQCSFTTDDGTTRTEGNAYVADGKVRTDSTITIEGKESMTSSSIISDGTMYAWGSMMPTGMKMSLDAVGGSARPESTSGTSNTAPQGADLDAQNNYQCAPWTVDPAVFALPSDVTFTDYTEMMRGASMSGAPAVGGTDAAMFEGEVLGDIPGAPSKQMLCGACDRAPDPESQAQCRAVAGCE